MISLVLQSFWLIKAALHRGRVPFMTTEIPLSLWTQLDPFARAPEVEESTQPFFPVRSSQRLHERGFYSWRGCGKLYTEVTSIRRHEATDCRKRNTSPNASDRPVSLHRLMEG